MSKNTLQALKALETLQDDTLAAVSGGFLLDVISVKEAPTKPLSGTDLGSGRIK